MKRSPLRRGKPLTRRTPLRSRGRRKTPADAARAVLDRAGGRCEAQTSACTGRAEQCHHRRGRIGAGVHDPAALLAVCAACHDHIHAHPAESYEHGWMLPRLGNQTTAPVENTAHHKGEDAGDERQ